jgi:diguanylate cyclase (GGDEF)-like protein
VVALGWKLVDRRLLGVVSLLLAALWALLISTMQSERSRLVTQQRLELGQLTASVAGHASAVLSAVETDMHVVELWLRDHPGIDAARDRALSELVDQMRSDSPGGVVDLVLLSTDGKLYGVVDDRVTLDIHDRPYYTALQKPGPRRVAVADPVLARGGRRRWILPVTWRLEQPVAGVLALSGALDLELAFAAFEDLRAQASRTVTLLRDDGLLLTTTPFDRDRIGKPAALEWRIEAPGAPERGSFVVRDEAGQGQIFSYQRLGRYPVKVVVKTPLEAVLQPYHRTRRLLVGTGALLSVVALSLTVLLHRALQARHAAQRELERLATQDELTGLLNRRAFLEAAEAEFRRARRYGRPTAVILLDVDHFKQINDTHGHAAGDEVLRRFAEAVVSTLRTADFIGRIGGEEFAALLPETSRPEAQTVAERVRERVAALRVGDGPLAFAVAVSAGLTVLEPTDERLEDVLERADRALYQAKQTGRNRVATA